MKHIKISIIGCSVALRARPPEDYPDNKNYGQLLSEELEEKFPDHCVTVTNHAFTRATIKDILPKIESLILDYPHYFILNIGIPDASTREIPRILSNLITYKKNLLISVIFNKIHSLFIKPHIRKFVLLRGKRSWVTEKEFEELYKSLILYLKKETNARIIILPINPPSDRIENKLPGTKANVKKFNRIIRDLPGQFINVQVVDIDELDQKTDFPDGIHFSLTGHKKISNKIAKLVNLDI